MKEFRMKRMFNNSSISVLAIDHGLANGLINGLEAPLNVINEMCGIGCKNILLNKGIAFDIIRDKECVNSANIILNMSAGLNFEEIKICKTVFTSFETAIRLDAVAVAIQIDFNRILSKESIKEIGLLVDEAYRWEIPVLAMVYVDSGSRFKIVDAVRIVEELGVDMIKIMRPRKDEEQQIITNSKIPILLAGGKYDNTSSYEEGLAEALDIGYSGLVVGRNIFQREDSKGMMKKIIDMIEKRG